MMQVYLSPRAENTLYELLDYLLKKWGTNATENFLKKFEKKLALISKHPESCPKSNVLEGLYKCVVTKQCALYYRVNKKSQEIEIITIFDTRRNPDQLVK